MLGVLAGIPGPADTAVRVPGTALRFGLADSVTAARGFAPAGAGSLAGRCRFFGMDGDATPRLHGRTARPRGVHARGDLAEAA